LQHFFQRCGAIVWNGQAVPWQPNSELPPKDYRGPLNKVKKILTLGHILRLNRLLNKISELYFFSYFTIF